MCRRLEVSGNCHFLPELVKIGQMAQMVDILLIIKLLESLVKSKLAIGCSLRLLAGECSGNTTISQYAENGANI